MKAKFTVLIALATMGIAFSSCTKFYDCTCTDYKGQVTKTVVKAKTPQQANRNCTAVALYGSCELE